MSLQGWFNAFEFLSFISAATVISGLVLEYGKDLFKVLKFWEPGPHIAEIEVETFKKKRGSVLVVAGIFLELVATGGIAVTSDRIETQHRTEIATLNAQRLELQYLMDRFANGRHVKVLNAYSPFVLGEAPPAVLIQNVSNDEADRLACELAFVLQKWARRVDASVSHFADVEIPDGIAIQCSDCGSTDKPHNNTVLQAELLRQFLVNWPNVVAAKVSQLPPTNSVPEGGILILIGKHTIDFDMDALATAPLKRDEIMDKLARATRSRSAQLNWVSGCVPKQ